MKRKTYLCERMNHRSHTYYPDFQGNIAQVWNVTTGELVQLNEYFPDGTPTPRTLGEETQPYKYNGNEWVRFNGNDAYDFNARQYQSTLLRFDRPDDKSEDYYPTSPYTFCGGNPVKYSDSTGEAWRPTYNVDENNNIIYNCSGYEWVDESESYNEDGSLKEGLYHQAIFFTDYGTYNETELYNIGSAGAFVYKEDGSIEYYDACTNPSSSSFAKIPEGVYTAQVGIHHGKKSSYEALKVRDIDAPMQTIELGENNPAHPERTYAEGIDIHKAGKNNYTGGHVSEGCLLISTNQWADFMNNFNTKEQKNNTISITISRSLQKPTPWPYWAKK